MKLVDILARELKAWPESWGIYCVSSKVDGAFAAWFGYRNPVFEDGGWSDIGTVEIWLSEEPEDRKNVVVRRFEWQAAVDALKAEVHPTESMALHHQEVGRITRQWNGEGLPPVGVVCEAKTTRGWSRGTIIAHGLPPKENIAVWQEDGERISLGVKEYFRQIRTPEQIAAEERDRSISEMREIWNFAASSGADPFIALHSAGYRKFEIVDN